MAKICKMTGATLLNNLADMEGEESIDPSSIGMAGEVYEDNIGYDEFIFIKEGK